jgi:hypothetical protein
MDAHAPRHERERRIIEDLIARDNRFKGRTRDIAELVIEAKRQALSSESPDKILELIERKLEDGATVAAAKAETSTDSSGHAPTATALSAIERNAAVQG